MSTVNRPLRQAQGRLLYRTRQFFAAIRPRVNQAELNEASALLGQRLMPLFLSMCRRDQRHCLDVYGALVRMGCHDQNVLLAALLHDAGKGELAGARVRLWHRVAYVLLAAGTPRLLARLAGGRGGLAALHHHSERGAMLAERHGAPAEVVDLIRRHEATAPADERLLLLRAADDSC